MVLAENENHATILRKRREIGLKSGRKKSEKLCGSEDFLTLKLPIKVQISCEVTDT